MSPICPECGKRFPEGARSCNWCKPESEAFKLPGYECPTCGVILPDGRPCPYCVAPTKSQSNPSKQQTGDLQLIGGALGLIFSVLFGVFAWGGVIAFAKGSVGAIELIVFWSPIIFAVAPGIVRLTDQGSRLSVLWAIAIAPIFGVLNMLPFFVFYSVARLIFGSGSQWSEITGALLSSVIWICLHFVYRDSSSSDQGRDPGVRTLRKPPRYY